MRVPPLKLNRFIRSAGFVLYLTAILAALTGCMSYTAQPLTDDAVNRRLAVPSVLGLRVLASQINHPILKPVAISDLHAITPDEAAIIAVLVNPSLRTIRDQRGSAEAAVLTAGILPNPQLSVGEDFPTGGGSGTVNAYALGVNWDVTQLITRDARVRASREKAASVYLDIAWQEWQFAQAAKIAVFDLASLQAQLSLADDIDKRMGENAALLRAAVRQGSRSVLELAAAEAASQDAHGAALAAQRDVRHQFVLLNRALGLPADTVVGIDRDIALPSRLELPSRDELLRSLEKSRLDLIALRCGYQSQEQTLRAAVLAQFPKITVGFNKDRDSEGVNTLGFGVTMDIPVFDRNQGAIADETATRQRLFDEYAQRVFEARSDVLAALDDIHSIEAQLAAEAAAAKSLDSLVETYRVARQSGRVDVLTYYSAIASLEQKKISMLKLQRELMDNQIALEIASGRYLPNKLKDDSGTSDDLLLPTNQQ